MWNVLGIWSIVENEFYFPRLIFFFKKKRSVGAIKIIKKIKPVKRFSNYLIKKKKKLFFTKSKHQPQIVDHLSQRIVYEFELSQVLVLAAY